MYRVCVVLTVIAAAWIATAGPAQAVTDLTHHYTFSDTDGLTDSAGNADGTALGDAVVSGGYVLVNLLGPARDGRVDLLSNGANGININTYTKTTIEFWAIPNCGATDGSCAPFPNDSFSTALGLGSVYAVAAPPPAAFSAPGAGSDYIIMQTHRGDNFSRGAIAVTEEATLGAPWGAETGVNGAEFNDSAEHHYALVIDATELEFFVDGVSAGTAPLANPNEHGHANSLAGVSNDHAWIGSGYEIDQRWAGAMNELRIWDGAAADEYIANSFAAGPDRVTGFIDKVPEPASLGLAFVCLCSLGGALRRRVRS